MNKARTFQIFWCVVTILCLPVFAQGQSREVKGVVTDMANGMTIPGATVMIKGTDKGSITDIDGSFTISANPDDVLIISFVGYQTTEVIASATSLSVGLSIDIKALEEVVVVGYGTVRKSDLTGSVGTVEVEEIQKLATTDVARTIQGKVAGVQVTSNSGAPGTGTSIRVRGIGSLNNSNPLFVVDGFLTGDISNISANDIVSMEVLKDASATAIYGSRGANGVILITTKSGSKDGLKVEFNAYGGLQQAWKTMDVLNAEEYAQLYLESLGGPGATSLTLIDVSDKREWIRGALSGKIMGTDWQEYVLRNAPIQNYDLSISGGGQKLQYRIGGLYFDQQGIVQNTYGKRLQGNAQISYSPVDKLRLSASLKYSDNDYINYDQGTYSSVLGTALRKDPINQPIDPITGNWDRTGLTDVSNPARLMELQKDKVSEAIRYQPNISAEFELIDGLILKSTLSTDHRTIVYDNLTPKYTTVLSLVLDENGQPSVSPNESLVNEQYLVDESIDEVIQNTNILNYNKIVSKHSINALLGFETFQNNSSFRRSQIYRERDSTAELQYTESAFNLMSYFGRIVYSFDDRFLITGTIRRDGSSKFPENDRWGTFPSFSLGWNVDQESFMSNSSIISLLKLRGGWGEVGNQDPISPYRFRSTLSPGWSYAFDNQTPSDGYAATVLPASTITWEKSISTNFGVDLGLLEDQINFTAEYYIRRTQDLLVNTTPSPVFAGMQAPSSNAASMENTGIELSLGYQHVFNALSLNVGGNISFVSNEVTGLGAGERIAGAGYEPKVGMNMTRTIVGEEFASFYGLRTLGIFQNQNEIDEYGLQPLAKPGDVKYMDTNDDGVITPEDAVYLGSAIPDFTYGFYLNASYNNFDLSLSITGTQGNEIANVFTYYNAGSSALDNNMLRSRLDRWTGEGTSNSEPRITQDVTQNDLFSDRYIEDGSFMRLRNLQIGYVMPESFVNKMKMKYMRVYLSTDNLFTITKYSGFDPEVGLAYGDSFAPGVDLGNYPQARTIILGVNIKLF